MTKNNQTTEYSGQRVAPTAPPTKTNPQPKTPPLRFGGFVGEWEERKLGEVATFSKGKGLSKKDIVEDGENECVRYGELYTTYKEVIKDAQSKTNIKKENSFISKKYDVLIPSSGETAIDIATASCIEKDDVILGGDLNVLRFNSENFGTFFAYYLSGFKKRDIAKFAQGNSVVHLYASNIKNLKITIPTKAEQEKIASFLSVVDEWVENLKGQKEDLEKYKKGVMQKLFPQKGEQVPQLRFSGFTGNWEEKKLGEVFDLTRGYVLAVKDMKQQKDSEYKYPVYSSQTKKDGLVGYYKEYLYENAITWTTDGANAGETKFRKGKFYCTNVSGVLLNKDGHANQCIAEMINLVSKRYVSYVGNPKLMNNVMEIIKIKFPPLPEQEKIASFLTALDDIIEKTEQKISQAEQWKKGLMQRLFV